MRQAFINTLTSLAETDSNLYLLTADMGFGLVEPFATRYPKQYINVGVAEQNMIGVATGLALEGKRVFCYSIGNFPTMRCLEQIRNDVCYHNLPVCIMSGGAGLWYSSLGMTHWALEDIAVMRCLPNMAVVSPADAKEMSRAIDTIYRRSKPCYLRMSRTAVVHNESEYIIPDPEYWFGKTTAVAQNGSDPHVIIIATGGQMVATAIKALDKLSQKGIRVWVLNQHTVKPETFDVHWLSVLYTKLVVTIEEHSRIGGLGSAVAEVLAGMRHHPPLVRLGTGDCYPDRAMSYEELLKYHHLDVDGIVKEVLDALR